MHAKGQTTGEQCRAGVRLACNRLVPGEYFLPCFCLSAALVRIKQRLRRGDGYGENINSRVGTDGGG